MIFFRVFQSGSGSVGIVVVKLQAVGAQTGIDVPLCIDDDDNVHLYLHL